MSNESVDVKIARLEVTMSQMMKELESSERSRKAQYDTITQLNHLMVKMGGQLENLEKQVATAQPTIEEFITIKHKVVGAGWLGRWLWVAGGVLLGFVAANRKLIGQWFQGG